MHELSHGMSRKREVIYKIILVGVASELCLCFQKWKLTAPGVPLFALQRVDTSILQSLGVPFVWNSI